MEKDDRSTALRALTDALWQAWTKAGPLSYNEFAKRSRRILGLTQQLSASTIHAVLKDPHRRQPPRWGWVVRFWTVLLAVANEHGIDPDTLGTLEELKPLHEAADSAQHRARQLAGTRGAGSFYRVSLPQSTLVFSDADAWRDERLASIRRKVGADWWRDYEDVVPSWSAAYLSLERAAYLVRIYDTAVVPALIQTEAYADAVLRLESFALSAAAIARITELRMRQQQIVRQENAPRLWVTLDESALRRRLGDTRVMRDQLTHLIDISALRNVTIQVIPSVTSIRVTLGYPVTVLRFREQEMPDVAYIEQLTSASYLHDLEHVGRYVQVLDGLTLEALTPADTVDYLCRLLRDL